MSRLYTDYINKTALTVPDEFIDVKTGESHLVSSKVHEQIEYHAANQTLIHLVLSALNSYFHSNRVNGGTKEILNELSEIKQMLRNGYSGNNFLMSAFATQPPLNELDLDMKDIEDILEEFGG
ncbi:hypothetical protein V7128_11350 [Neobacillus vireti]|uniref:hypothetical protein n=1 Tax=Neobacillus vireti TaxID=220686 RepID=UPI002FFEFD53